AELANLDAPSGSLILGEGSGGGALALIPTDRVLSAEHGWLSPLPPEGASAIVHRTTERAPEMAQSQGVHAPMLKATGGVDRIIAEHPDAPDEPLDFGDRVGPTPGLDLNTLL